MDELENSYILDESVSVEKKLDIILKRIKEKQPVDFQSIWDFFKCTKLEYDALMKQLQAVDGFIEPHTDLTKNGKIRILTVKGMLFEGYVKQKEKEKRTALMQSLPIWVTAIGTGLSGLYILGKLFLWLISY